MTLNDSSRSLKFNPPIAEAKKLPRYASYAGGVMKTHGGVGFAKNSLNNRMWTYRDTDEQDGDRINYDGTPRMKRERVTTYAAILENVDGTWYTLYEVPEGTKRNDLPWVKAQFRPSYGGWYNVEDYKDHPYYKEKLETGVYRVSYNNVTMTVDEYVNWRLAVERERAQDAFRETQVERLVSK